MLWTRPKPAHIIVSMKPTEKPCEQCTKKPSDWTLVNKTTDVLEPFGPKSPTTKIKAKARLRLCTGCLQTGVLHLILSHANILFGSPNSTKVTIEATDISERRQMDFSKI
jgi:hypothetical protein